MERYVHRRRADGIYIINLEKTYEKLLLAARVIVAIENPQVRFAVCSAGRRVRLVLVVMVLAAALCAVVSWRRV